MDIWAIVGLAIVCTVLCVLLKQYKPEYAMLVSIMCIGIIFISLINQLQPVLNRFENLFQQMNLSNEYIKILIKALGITYVVEIASDISKDMGQNAIASKLELAGKVAIIVLCLPLVEDIISISFTLIQL